MQNPFWNSAGPRFIRRDEALSPAREIADRIALRHAEVIEILLFGSFAREDYGSRRNLDFLIVVRHSGEPARERIDRFLVYAPAYPTDMPVYTERDLQVRLSEGHPFLARALQEAIQLYP